MANSATGTASTFKPKSNARAAASKAGPRFADVAGRNMRKGMEDESLRSAISLFLGVERSQNPNLDAEGVLAGADEGLHGQILLEGFEKQLDFPALFVDRSDGGGSELQQIGQQDDLALVFGIPSDDAAQQVRIVGLGLDTGEEDELVGADVAVLRDLAFLDHLKGGVLLQAGDKENAGH